MAKGGIAVRTGLSTRKYKGKLSTAQRIAGVTAFDKNRAGTHSRCAPDVWRRICIAVKNRDGHRCVRCGADPEVDYTVKLTVDHIIPHAQGGSDLPSNLRTLCLTCHKKRIGRANRRGSRLLEARFG